MSLRGFYDPAAIPGPITGSGPNYERAMQAFRQREVQKGLVGTWRHKDGHKWKKDVGRQIDKDYEIRYL